MGTSASESVPKCFRASPRGLGRGELLRGRAGRCAAQLLGQRDQRGRVLRHVSDVVLRERCTDGLVVLERLRRLSLLCRGGAHQEKTHQERQEHRFVLHDLTPIH